MTVKPKLRSPQVKVYRGNVVTPSSGGVVVFEQGYLVVDTKGVILSVGHKLPAQFKSKPVVDFESKFIVPGLIDVHTHLSQFAFAGLGGSELLSWLQRYTFPQEAKYSDVKVARHEASNFFEEALSLGTTTLVAYVTSHSEATHAAFEMAEKHKIRAYLGQVLMNANVPKNLSRDRKTSIRESEALIKKWHGKGRLRFAVSPRFALSCTRDLLEDAGELAKENKLILQTHLAESRDEIRAVLKFHNWAKTYTDVYATTGCLGKRTLLGHCIHLAKSEVDTLKKTKSVIVHCPTSNRFLASGAMSLRGYLNRGLRVALGSDVAAGYSLSLFNEAKEAIETSKQFAYPLSVAEALRMATLAGAEALGEEKNIGSLEVGKQADFVVLDDGACHPCDGHPHRAYTSPFEALARFMYRNNPKMVLATFIAGECVYQR